MAQLNDVTNSAERSQKYPWGMIVGVLVTVALSTTASYQYASNKMQNAYAIQLKQCQDEKTDFINRVMIKGGLINDDNYQHIADSLAKVMSKSLQDKEIIKTK